MIKILLVEDDHVIRTGFKKIIEDQPGLTVIGETDDGADAISLTLELEPDIILMDLKLRHSTITGAQATRKISALERKTKVIILSAYDDAIHVKSAIKAGACGYLSKGCTEDDLIEAIDKVMSGKVFFSDTVRAVVEDEFVCAMKYPSGPGQGPLSERELEVLRLLTEVDSDKEVGAKLDISPKTVGAHRRSLMRKLKLGGIGDLVKYALRNKIIELDE